MVIQMVIQIEIYTQHQKNKFSHLIQHLSHFQKHSLTLSLFCITEMELKIIKPSDGKQQPHSNVLEPIVDLDSVIFHQKNMRRVKIKIRSFNANTFWIFGMLSSPGKRYENI